MEDISNLYQSETKDDTRQKQKIDYIACLLKNLTLQKEFAKLEFNEGVPFKDEKSRKAYYLKYKMRVVVHAIRQYHKQGSKGSLQTGTILLILKLFLKIHIY